MAAATLFEEHASVLPHWVGRGLHGATLVCLDAHLDLQFIDPARIARLRACASAAEVARLESPHPLAPRGEACFGIEDFLYPAAQLGLLHRLVWVAPPHVLGRMDAALQALRQMEGVTREDLASFRRVPGGWIEGRLLGLQLAAGTLEQLQAMPLEGPLALDIDTDYFVQVPEDRIWADPSAVVSALRQWAGPGHALTIARSVGTGFLPLRHRFLADLLAALWEGREGDVAHWQALLDLERNEVPAPQRRAVLEALLARRPDSAAAWHALGLASEPGPGRDSLLAHAASLDPHYGDDLVRRLGEYRARWKQVDLATVVALQREVEALRGPPERQAIAWTALGLLYAAFGRLPQAIACDEQGLRHGVGHPDLALQIGELHLAVGQLDAAGSWLARAAEDDETRVVAWHRLAQCAAARGASGEARRWSERARAAAPAWDGP